MSVTTELPGLDLHRLADWLDTHQAGRRQGPLTGELITGGRSNLTYRVADERSTWALRRPPLGHVLPTAHDMSREYRVLTALSPTEVPVPEPIVLCSDAAVLGAPFYLMGFVPGPVVNDANAVAAMSPAQATRAGELLADTLLALHALDPTAIGLGDFGHPDGYLSRQLSRWHTQWRASETRPLADLETVIEQLTRGRPNRSAPGIVHGDYRMGNVIYTPGFDRIAAVIDWEMATVGDPLADLGLLIVYHSLAGDPRFRLVDLPASAGFRTADQLADRYRAGSPRDLDRLDWYVAFGYFKLAVISETIRRRHLSGQTVGTGFDEITDTVPLLLRAALRSLTA